MRIFPRSQDPKPQALEARLAAAVQAELAADARYGDAALAEAEGGDPAPKRKAAAERDAARKEREDAEAAVAAARARQERRAAEEAAKTAAAKKRAQRAALKRLKEDGAELDEALRALAPKLEAVAKAQAALRALAPSDSIIEQLHRANVYLPACVAWHFRAFPAMKQSGLAEEALSSWAQHLPSPDEVSE